MSYAPTEAFVRSFQRAFGLVEDGIPGPKTYEALYRAAPGKPAKPPSAPQPTKLQSAGQAALMAAQQYWQTGTYDPQVSDHSAAAEASRSVIDSILKACGWGGEPYKGDGQVEWCGLFAGACWRAAGLDPKWLADYFPSTYRLDQWANYRDFGKVPNVKPSDPTQWRRVANLDQTSQGLPWAPQAGDILMIGDGLPAAGDHICIVESYNPVARTFVTYEGNGNGLLPDGTRRQGIVRGVRHLGGTGYCARRLIRPGTSDLL